MTEQEQFLYYQKQQYINSTLKKRQKSEIIKTGFGLGATLVVYLMVQTIFIAGLKLSGKMDLLFNSSIFGNSFNIIAVHICSLLIPFLVMALVFKKSLIAPLLPLKKFDTKLEPVCWVMAGMGWCCVGDMATGILMKVVEVFTDYKLTQSKLAEPDGLLACIIIVFSSVIIPGIVEEIAFRCCTLGVLRKYGKGFAVFAVSIVFGLIHGNVIQFVFAFTIGLGLGYITIKTDNILPAMFIHGINNGMSVLQDIVTLYSNKKTAEITTDAIFYFFIISSIFAIIYLGKNKKLKREKIAKQPWDNSFGTKILCLIPGLFLPIMFLVYSTIQTIVKQ